MPSTWAKEQSYNWHKMRDNTLEIEKYISENKELPKEWKKIDLVVPYVDSMDPEWQKII